ncbi:MAG: TetR family transcriptional regulator [Solirubrobacterales bacterium]|nr:TetR family transcriptional regulator [Solirubrobacterales bacterium]
MSTSYRGAVRQLLRDRLLDAGRDQLGERTWAQVTMAEIAAAAGVSRQTLYNEFGSRDEFAQALVIREGSRFLDAVEEALDEHSRDPVVALSAALERFLTIAREDPFVRLLLGDDGTGGMLPLVTTQSRPVLDWAGGRLMEAIDDHWPGVPAGERQDLADTLVRLAISHVAAPRESPRRAASSIARLLAPAIERMLSAADGR